MSMIADGVEVYGKDVEPIQNRVTLEAMSNQELLDMLIEAIEFQG
jgi:hypothetical protein